MDNEQIKALLEYLIGSQYVATVKPYISELTGRALIVGPGDVTTFGYNPERVQIATDEAKRITGFGFS